MEINNYDNTVFKNSHNNVEDWEPQNQDNKSQIR